jgi:hypothetical protein
MRDFALVNPLTCATSPNADRTYVLVRVVVTPPQISSGASSYIAVTLHKKAHSFIYSAGNVAMVVDGNGALSIGNAVAVSRAIVRGADSKMYGICSPWAAGSGTASFTV